MRGSEKTVKELKSELERIKEEGWIRSLRRGDTGIGYTFESLLGISENNISLPDLGKFEIKTARRDSKSLITLFSKVPQLETGISNKDLVEKYGYWDNKKNRQALYCTVSSIKENSLGWKIEVTNEEVLLFICKGKIIAKENIQLLRLKAIEKISNSVFIIADRKKQENKEYFHYNEAYLLTDIKSKNILDLIKNGEIVFDWRMHIKDNGAVRDHGPGYRIHERKIQNLYSSRRRLI